MVQYDVQHIPPDTYITIDYTANMEKFLKEYDQLFTPNIKKIIACSYLHNMITTQLDGIGLGRGQVWMQTLTPSRELHLYVFNKSDKGQEYWIETRCPAD